MSDEAFKLDTKNLDGILKALKSDMSRARIGILGSKTNRGDVKVAGGKSVDASRGAKPKAKFEVTTNAAVGMLHEFGTEKLPMRSFLRVPIAENLQKKLESSGAFGKDELKEVVKQGTTFAWLQKVAVIAENIVREAFETGGYGKWPKWAKGYKSNTGQILVDTQQLRNSISSEVK